MNHDELKTYLDKKGLPLRGRIKLVAEKTNYSTGMVSKMLSGHADISDRFLSSLSNSLCDPNPQPEIIQGMTLRDQFAMAAMSNLSMTGEVGEIEDFAIDAYRVADAMMKARGGL